MIKIFMLVVSLASVHYDDAGICVKTDRRCVKEAIAPRVTFFLDIRKATKDRDMLQLNDPDTARLFEIDICASFFCGEMEVEGDTLKRSERYPAGDPRRIVIKELKTVAVQDYEIKESTVSITE